MIPSEVAAALLLALWGILALLWLVWAPYLERKQMTEARRREREAERAKGPVRSRRTAWGLISPILLVGIPALLIVDGLFFRIGLLYSPFLSFFNPFDTYLQVAGVVLASAGLVIMVVAGRTLIREVYAKASSERRIITTGLYAYIRHPLYLTFFLIPIGWFLLALNVLGILFLLPFWFFTDSDLEICGRKGKLTFLTKSIECEEMALVQRFGADYEEYRARTGRLLPRIRQG